MTEIDDKYESLGGESSFLGSPTGSEATAPDGEGNYRHFQGGSIYYHPDTGAHEVHGSIHRKWSDLGWERSFLGYPRTDETPTPVPNERGRYNHFQNGSIYWHPNTGAHEVHGSIRRKWSALGWERSFLGFPTTDERTTPAPNERGRYNHFEGGSIYYHPDTGAHEVHGLIHRKWSDLGWERSFLGFPTTDETPTPAPNERGRYNHFQNGSIYWHPNTGAHEVHGSIRRKWSALGWERSFLGFPTTDERTTPAPNERGRYNHFEGGSIYYHPDTGAHEVHGLIRRKWSALGWERSFLGFPTTDETPTPVPNERGRYSHFQSGSIYWHPDTGAHEVHGAIRRLWQRNGWERVRFGFPTTDETPMNDDDSGRFTLFERGVIGWTPTMKAWADYQGNLTHDGLDPQGRVEGILTLFPGSNFDGIHHSYGLSSERPIVFPSDLGLRGLYDQVSSLILQSLPDHASVYLYEHPEYRGRWVKVTGDGDGVVEVADLSSHGLDNRISSAVLVDHGLVSVIVSSDTMEATARDSLASFAVSGVEWTGDPQVYVEPQSRLRIRLTGEIEETWPDTDLDLSIYFRIYMTGSAAVLAEYGGWSAHFGGSFAGYANDTIERRLRDYFDDEVNREQIAQPLNAAFAARLSQLVGNAIFGISMRRINFLPEGLELVISDDEVGDLVSAAGVGDASADRPAGQVTSGSV